MKSDPKGWDVDRTEARAAGWHGAHGLDYCPKCLDFARQRAEQARARA